MNREEAIQTVEAFINYVAMGNVSFSLEAKTGRVFLKALRVMVSELRTPWVKTSDRPPTEADAGYEGVVLASQKSYDIFYDCKIIALQWEFVANHPDDYDYWAPICPFPEIPAE